MSRNLLAVVLGKKGHDIVTVSTGHEALEQASKSSFDVAFLDIKLPDMLGVDLLSPLAEMDPEMAKVMITAYASTETAIDAVNHGAAAYITKPLRVKAVLTKLEEILVQQQQAAKQKEMVEMLHRYAADLEARNEELDAFAHTVAHDLKGPTNKILGYAEALLHEESRPLPEGMRRRCLEIVAQGARQVGTLVDDLLLLAQVRGEEVRPVPLDMRSIVSAAERRLVYLIKKGEAELIVPDTWPAALGYAPWVEEVWVNYISNAVKYGGSGEGERGDGAVPPRVELGFDASGGEGSAVRSQIRFWVRDNGSGLTPEEQKVLFTPFTRLDQVNTEGHGLGLSVVRRIVEKLGGEVSVKSQKGAGSVFSFTLPRADRESLSR
jgi:signal transduction histidine kinase